MTAPRPQERNGDLLVVENDRAYAIWLAETLQSAGYTVRVVATAEDALAAVSERLPSAILLDLRLDGSLDGWDVLVMLRARPETTDLPVVVVSSYEEYERGQGLGVAYYLVKPVGRERLLATLQQLQLNPAHAVLVVEDEPATRELVLQTLRSLELQTHGVASGEEALALLDAEPEAYCLLILDLGLPGMDGCAVLDAVYARPALRHLPVVVFTARTLTPEEQRKLAERTVEVVRKGNGVPLTEAVTRVLKG